MAAQLELALGGPMLQTSACVSKKRGPASEWDDERMLQLMMGPVERPSFPAYMAHYNSNMHSTPTTTTTTLDLFGKGPPPPPPPPPRHEGGPDDEDDDQSSCCFELDSHTPLPPGWEKCLDLMTGSIYYLNRSTGLSTSCDPRKATSSSVNWPTSPSSSSDLTYEAIGPIASSTSKSMNKVINGEDTDNLDLSLSLRPSSRLSLTKSHDQVRRESNHNLISLISSHGLQSFSSNTNLPLNSTRNSKSSGSFKFEVEQSNKAISANHNINAKCKPFSENNLNINVNSKPLSTNHLSISANANPLSANSPMITVGCANCLMFVMLPKSCSPKCPRCGASIDTDLPPQPPSSKKAKLGFSLSSFL